MHSVKKGDRVIYEGYTWEVNSNPDSQNNVEIIRIVHGLLERHIAYKGNLAELPHN
jgi:hypothetical protein